MSNYFGYVGKLFSNVKGFYNEINAATLTGAIDSIIIEQEDGTYRSSPFHVRFGKLGVLRSKEKVVDISINGKAVDLHMKLGDSGEAFFVTEVEEPGEDVPAYLATSPIPSHEDLMEQGVKEMKQKYFDQDDVLPSKGSEVRIQMEDPEGQQNGLKESHSKRRKKRRITKKRQIPSGNLETDKKPADEDDIPMFDIDDVSSDEELANLPPMPPLGTMGKSVSLPIMEETSLQRTSDWASTQYNTYSYPHPFSDTDISPMNSPASTRPPSPKSDTEVQLRHQGEVNELLLSEEDNTLWEWGDLPRKSVDETIVGLGDPQTPGHLGPEHQGTSRRSTTETSGGLFKFMRKTKAVRHKPEEEGIYLDDLKLEEMDPEIAKLYFPKRFHQSPFMSIKDKEEDTESGRGASLPVSPNSVEGAIGGPSVSFLQSEVKHLGNFSMSLCGGLSESEGVTLEKFMQSVVTFDDLCENYNMISNPELVIRIGEKYYNWQTAAPIILSQVVFNKDLPEITVDKLSSEYMPKKKDKKQGSRVSSWFSWRRTSTTPETGVSKLEASGSTLENLKTMSDSDLVMNKTQTDVSVSTSPHTSPPPSLTSSPRKERRITEDSVKADDEHTSSEADTDSDRVSLRLQKQLAHDMYKKTLRLSSEQIKSLNLREGANEVTFSVTTQYQGTTKCTSHIFLWRYDDKVIISDIDGTITKSDVLGQILPIIGKDWSQSGVAKLYTNIQSNGYKFLYLSARAIGQSKITKDLLKSIKQDYHVLPEGPLLLSPTSLVSAFHREVIEKRPEDFKIACLMDIAELFPNKKPFYAGFGNKINDVIAYKAIMIPSFRIFTINHKGELKQESAYTFQSSYLNLNDVADHFFPPVQRLPGVVAAEFSSVTYWRDPLPSLSSIDVSSPLMPEARPEDR
ncbi:Phosphatidate phosphatase LPIN2 [Mizuhopecten yessoensis]|uniref:phosphatidate phosphatase n=1 Tax=Mizuhopecten yessoensis TaxID=6573 RepID=A0A210QKP8_MIZYE|nr:Phosphatidate phosphatase LPIN2 [Mizuhopecten yessoensis]